MAILALMHSALHLTTEETPVAGCWWAGGGLLYAAAGFNRYGTGSDVLLGEAACSVRSADQWSNCSRAVNESLRNGDSLKHV